MASASSPVNAGSAFSESDTFATALRRRSQLSLSRGDGCARIVYMQPSHAIGSKDGAGPVIARRTTRHHGSSYRMTLKRRT